MNLQSFDDVLRQSADIEAGIGASHFEIEQAQAKLGVTFPSSFSRFLSTYGWAKLNHDYVYGLGPNVPDYANVVTATLEERESFEPFLPSHLVAIMNDGSGNHYCLDSSRIMNGESPVVFWDHESIDGQSQVPDLVSPTFAEWLFEKAKSSIE